MNEPVAWRIKNKNGEWLYYDEELVGTEPLYTHLVKEQDTDCQYCKQGCIRCDARKQLTDEEIMVLYEEYIETQYASESNVLGFGRAILRKAQDERK